MTNWTERHPAEHEALAAAAQNQLRLSQEMLRPSMILRPKLFIDGDRWCARHGEKSFEGVEGYGRSPEQAYEDFDRNWTLYIQCSDPAAPSPGRRSQ